MQKFKKMIVAATVAAILLTGMNTVNAAAAFTDTKTHWAKSQIDSAVGQGWINGYDDQTFKPNANMTRAEFLKSLVAALKLKVEDTDTPFADDKGWFRSYIATGLKQSIIKVGDYKESNFEPNKMITREEIARMTIRSLGKDAEGVKSGYLAIAKKLEIMKGYPDGSMGGEKNATRAESVVMITNTLTAKNPAVAVVAYPKTKEQLNALIQSLPNFKGTTTYGHNGVILINTKGSDDFFDNTLVVEYNTDLKQTNIVIADPTADNKAIVKDLLNKYYPKAFEKAYASYIKVNDMKFVEGNNSVITKYDGRSFGAYKANNNKKVTIEIGV
ncbi:S-layer homology domain-containing protein [Paenibacillus sinopodophylli]|uniref:S-layer homology domain-containing protein n=1 Tax=Paenibacillus sinopodophylli TaxID=1837342 RepID=UPI00110CC539|nr:S-layer homology domain-containing protein [Paenibacillus sinopodophylli]